MHDPNDRSIVVMRIAIAAIIACLVLFGLANWLFAGYQTWPR